MSQIALTTTIARLEPCPEPCVAATPDLVLGDVRDADGFPLPDGLRLTDTGPLRALEFMPGDRIAFDGQLAAYAGSRCIAEEVVDVLTFLWSLPVAERGRISFRIAHPSGVRRVRPIGGAHD